MTAWRRNGLTTLSGYSTSDKETVMAVAAVNSSDIFLLYICCIDFRVYHLSIDEFSSKNHGTRLANKKSEYRLEDDDKVTSAPYFVSVVRSGISHDSHG